MRKLLLLSVVASTVAFAQAKPSPTGGGARDAGFPGAVTVGPIRPAGVGVDGGIVAAPLTAAPIPSLEVEKLRKEVAELRMKTAEIESRSQAKVDQLTTQMDRLSKQLDDMQSKINKVSESEDKRVEQEQQEATRRTSTAAASSNINAALTSLSTGNTSGVDQTLRYAESVYSGNALKNVQAARAALVNGDTFAAREHLIMAIIDADAQR